MEQLIKKYQLLPADQDCFELCKNNKNIIPKYIRPLELGYFQLICVSSTNSKKYFLIELGGSDYNAYENSIEKLNKLTLNDAISFSQLKVIF